ENSSLHYAVGDFSPFANKNILISGGGDSAVDWANELHSIAKTVTVVHRRDKLRAFEHSVQKMKKQVDVLRPYTAKTLHGDGGFIKRVTLATLETGTTQKKDVDAVLVNHGFKGEIGGVERWGLETCVGQIVVNNAME